MCHAPPRLLYQLVAESLTHFLNAFLCAYFGKPLTFPPEPLTG